MMGAMDHQAYRADSRDRWERIAAGWGQAREAMQRAGAPVSRWMVDAITPRPGHTVLELAAGPGDTGLMAAQRVAPDGRAIITDGAEAMVEIARERARELQLDNVEIRPMEAEWIDLSAASVDGVLCRWGYMLLADPEAALRETRRVLRPGGRVALAAWDEPEHNPWMTIPGGALVRRGLTEPPDPQAPGPFAFARPGRIKELLLAAGFEDVELDAVEVVFEAASLDAWWDFVARTSPRVSTAIEGLAPADHYALRDDVDAALASFVDGDGFVRLPGRTLVATAGA